MKPPPPNKANIFKGGAFLIMIGLIPHCFWPAMHRFWQNVLRIIKKCPFFQILRSRRSDTPRSSDWLRWKADNFLLNSKKNPDEKYFFIVEKFDFENSKILKILKIQKIFLKNIKIFNTIKYFSIQFFQNYIFFKYFRKYFQKLFKIFFQNQKSPWWKNIFHPDFF